MIRLELDQQSFRTELKMMKTYIQKRKKEIMM
jgi:hypothetical protein